MKLKEIREEMNLSQKELSIKLNVSPTNIYNYENGRTEPSIDMLIKIADVLNVSIDYLVGRTDESETVLRAVNEPADNERELLSLFHKLDVAKQNRLIGYANALIR